MPSTPIAELYRIASARTVLSWPPVEVMGRGRFDDPNLVISVLYAATVRRAAFVEVLARWRPAIGQLGERGTIPSSWLESRAVARFRLVAREQTWLDLATLDTLTTIRREMAPTLIDLGYNDLDLGDTFGRDRRLTQAIAGWAIAEGYGAIRYPSRFDPSFELWAIFEGSTLDVVEIGPIAPNDPDLLAVARLFDLTLGSAAT